MRSIADCEACGKSGHSTSECSVLKKFKKEHIPDSEDSESETNLDSGCNRLVFKDRRVFSSISENKKSMATAKAGAQLPRISKNLAGVYNVAKQGYRIIGKVHNGLYPVDLDALLNLKCKDTAMKKRLWKQTE